MVLLIEIMSFSSFYKEKHLTNIYFHRDLIYMFREENVMENNDQRNPKVTTLHSDH